MTEKIISLERCINSFYNSILFEKEKTGNKLQL